MPADSHGTDPYGWAFWWPNGPTSTPWAFWLFTPEGGRTYLVFSAGTLYIADVTEPRDPLVAFHEDFGRGTPLRAYESVGERLVAEKMLEMGGQFELQHARPWSEPVSLTRDKDGDLVLEMRYTHNDFHGTLARKNGRWELVGVQKEPPPSGRELSPKEKASMRAGREAARSVLEQFSKPDTRAPATGPEADKTSPAAPGSAGDQPAGAPRGTRWPTRP